MNKKWKEELEERHYEQEQTKQVIRILSIIAGALIGLAFAVVFR